MKASTPVSRPVTAGGKMEAFQKLGTKSVIIADESPIMRHGIRSILEASAGYLVISQAGDGLEAVREAERLVPAILIINLALPRLHGLEVARNIHRSHPEIKLIIISKITSEQEAFEALSYQAMAIVETTATTDQLLHAVNQACAGRRYLSPAFAESLLNQYGSDPKGKGPDPYGLLTSRERQVLQLTAEGLGRENIAQRLYISQRTVETHRAHLMKKLACHSQTDLVRFAIRRGIITA